MSKHRDDSKTREAPAAPPLSPEAAALVPETAKEAGPEIPATASDVQTAELEAARSEIATLKAEVAELNEKYLRKLADEVNFRKRMMREKEEAQKYAITSLLGDLVPILDDFDRGISSVETTKSHEQLSEGMMLIRKQLSQMLENKYALKRFESKGTPFDPNRHEALFAEPADVEEATVSEEYLPGYSLHDRVLRTAKVRVKVPGPKKPAESAELSGTVGQA
jgi:molecular chaperone GrpE